MKIMKLTQTPKPSGLKGVSTVEFALVLPIFLMIVFALIDLSFYFYYEQSMTHVVRSSLRYAITGQIKDDNFTADTNDFLNRRDSVMRAAKEEVPPLLLFRSSNFGDTNGNNYSSDLIQLVSTSRTGVVATNAADLGGSGALVKMIYTQDAQFLTPLPRMLNPGNVFSNKISVSTTYRVERYE